MQSAGFLLKRKPVRHRFTSPAGFVFACCILALAGCGFFGKKEDPVASANAFFKLLCDGKMEEAYSGATFTFQAQQSLQSFVAAAQDLDLPDALSVTWTRKVAKEKEATLEGVISTKAGQSYPVSVTLLEEAGKWKLYALHTPGRGDGAARTNRFSIVGRGPEFANSAQKPAPPEKEIRALVSGAFARIGEAVRSNSYDALFDSLAPAAKNLTSPTRLQRRLQPLAQAGMPLEGLEKMEAHFDAPPALDLGNLLTVTGTFPTTPDRVHFSLKFSYELPNWKLADISIKPLPAEQAAQALARETLLSFDETLRTKDFAGFYAALSPAWQSQITEAQLRRAFQPFLDANARVDAVKNSTAVWDAPPKINTDGVLILSGYYPAQVRIIFMLRYAYEAPEWKLFGIDVKLAK